MKKVLLMAAAVMVSAASFADSFTKTKLGAEGSSFEFSANEKYVVIYLGDETKAQKASAVAEADWIYVGPNNAANNLWVWPGGETLAGAEAIGLNSFGIPGEYMSWVVAGGQGWSGAGYDVEEPNTDLSIINNDWSLHFAVKSSTNGENITFVFDNVDGHGKSEFVMDSNASSEYGFDRDGEWTEFEIPVSYLNDKFGFDMSAAKAYTGNIFTISGGGTDGTDFAYDAVFFHGPKTASAIQNVTAAQADENAPIYNLAGQQVGKNYKGVAIQNGKKFIVK